MRSSSLNPGMQGNLSLITLHRLQPGVCLVTGCLNVSGQSAKATLCGGY